METTAQIFLEQLGIDEDLHVTVRFSRDMPVNLKGITFPPAQDIHTHTQYFRILINSNVPHRKRLKVPAHEMIHVKQYATKELIVEDFTNILWQGEKYAYSRDHNHQAPWEIEAYGYDKQLVGIGQTALIAIEQQQAQDLSTTFICMEEMIKEALVLSINNSLCKEVFLSY